mgnify:FL=1
MFRAKIRQLISEAARERFGILDASEFSVIPPENLEHGDYAINAALVLAKVLGKNPMEIASAAAEELGSRSSELGKVEVAPPGFINFFLSERALQGALADVLAHPDAWGKSDIGKGKIVMVEYFQLNIAKQPHIGHIRSAIIGDALKRILQSQGYNAVSDTHIGDWGTQFGILLWEIKEQSIATTAFENLSFDQTFTELENLYQAGVHRVENTPGGRDRAKAEFAKLEQGDGENREIWRWLVDVSMKKLEESSARLNLLPFDEHRGESFYEDKMAPIVEMVLQKGIAKKTDDGAVVVDLTSEGLDEAIMIKSDAATT